MKTFETEKHSIPEGATHYRNEDKNSIFTWLKVGDSVEIWCDIFGCWKLLSAYVNTVMDQITPIPQAKEVEWVNGLPPVGEECVFTPHNMQCGFNHIEDFTGTVLHYEGEQFIFMLNHTKYKLEGEMVIVSRTDKGDFSKPETPEAKEKREREEAISEMSLVVEMGNGFAGDAYKKYCASLYDAGYRKESE